ncbi:flagellar hook-basal body complex protein FliE [Caulobacter sp. CCUG 60055]|uniref:flagellar hook-basal body complex protein FliE n=1 Tax=Caulobacter sp. CCUG 60055 TaxID=2100090 RepID=UPI001FA78808|nr:flagellar hook-basal body complex protein FliE [Caulobacter sp. CCUG 60055]MBQ1542079.1 flagellar hook-basal body complex protein FliE [Caulobacteraceae bacterium]MCI3180208.1 flagellar hook-basal body complex protein FliE [Caulobacter sp. CCUG 60055]
MVAPMLAAKAYAAVQAASQPMGGAAGPVGAQGATSGFADVLKSVMTDTVGASRNAEKQMAAQVQGKADLVDVVTAVSSAETSLETVMAVRDQVISAYQEIMRMPI